MPTPANDSQPGATPGKDSRWTPPLPVVRGLLRGTHGIAPDPTPAQIVAACLDPGNDDAWAAFVQRFQPLIAASIARVARRQGIPDPALIDRLTQETYLRLCRNNCRELREFRAPQDEAIFGYLKVIATSVALDYFRPRATQRRRGEIPGGAKAREGGILPKFVEPSNLLFEIEAHIAAHESERDRTIFALYYGQRLTAREIASMPGIRLTQRGVEACIHRMTQSVRAARKLKKAEPPKRRWRFLWFRQKPC